MKVGKKFSAWIHGARRACNEARYGLIGLGHFLRAWGSRRPLFLAGCHSGPFAGNAYHFLKHTHHRPGARVVGVAYPQARYALVRDGLPWVPRGSWMARCLAKRAAAALGTGYPYANIGPECAGALQVMMWHGMPIKGVGLQCQPEPAFFPETDVCVATSPFMADIMGRVFGLPPERVLCTGEPKTDGFVDPGRPDLRRMLGGEYRKIVLYAPTFREEELHPDGKRDPRALVDSILRSERIRQTLARHQACMVLALHPFDRTLFAGALEAPFFFSVSLDLCTEHLMAAADFFISDYSSLVIDWTLLSRPMGLYCPDLEPYKASRGFPYFDFREVFGPFIHGDVEGVAEAMDRALAGDRSSAEPLLRLKSLFHQHDAGGASARLFVRILDNIQTRSGRAKVPPPETEGRVCASG